MASSRTIEQIAAHYGVSAASAQELLDGLRRTGGRQVQFSLPELGGIGQWMPGMVMVGNLFDHALKARVDGLCTELAALAASEPIPTRGTVDSGAPATAGGQNESRYAYFPDTNRLRIERAGTTTLYDTTGYRIFGAAQQQGSASTLTFSTDRGTVTVDVFPLVAD
jgi:hypothetical protein